MMISNTSLASFSSAIGTLRNVSGVTPRATPTNIGAAPSISASPGGVSGPPSSSSPRGSMLDISA